jgi:quercetin dioxygenase-like cupin family protein
MEVNAAPASPVRAPLTMTIGMTGERFEYLTSSRRGDGWFRFRWTLAPGRKGPPEHLHPDETETFTVESGVLQVWVGGVHHRLEPGMTLAVPPGAPHRFLNEGPAPAVVMVGFDGSRNEALHVPAAAYLAGGRAMGLGTVLRMMVHDAEVGGSLATFEPINALQRGLARVLRWFGVRPFPAVEW